MTRTNRNYGAAVAHESSVFYTPGEDDPLGLEEPVAIARASRADPVGRPVASHDGPRWSRLITSSALAACSKNSLAARFWSSNSSLPSNSSAASRSSEM